MQLPLSKYIELNVNNFQLVGEMRYDLTYGFECDNPKVMEMLGMFHAKEVEILRMDDDYFMGIRAETFCLELGYSEMNYYPQQVTYDVLVITANHKGFRVSKVYQLRGGII